MRNFEEIRNSASKIWEAAQKVHYVSEDTEELDEDFEQWFSELEEASIKGSGTDRKSMLKKAFRAGRNAADASQGRAATAISHNKNNPGQSKAYAAGKASGSAARSGYFKDKEATGKRDARRPHGGHADDVYSHSGANPERHMTKKTMAKTTYTKRSGEDKYKGTKYQDKPGS